MSESLAIFTSSRAKRYGVFLPRWWDALTKLQRQPDQIVIVHHESNLAGLPGSVPKDFQSRLKLVSTTEEDGLEYPNLCVGAAETDWVAFCGLDDQVMPNAYDELLAAKDAEIMVGNIVLSSGEQARSFWDIEKLKTQNTLPCHSPFRKSLWERVGGWPHVYWADWGFWMKCAMANATTFQANNFQVRFDLGETHETESGLLLDPHKRQAADEEIQAFAREIGFVHDP